MISLFCVGDVENKLTLYPWLIFDIWKSFSDV